MAQAAAPPNFPSIMDIIARVPAACKGVTTGTHMSLRILLCSDYSLAADDDARRLSSEFRRAIVSRASKTATPPSSRLLLLAIIFCFKDSCALTYQIEPNSALQIESSAVQSCVSPLTQELTNAPPALISLLSRDDYDVKVRHPSSCFIITLIQFHFNSYFSGRCSSAH
jgi:hypothetical protein